MRRRDVQQKDSVPEYSPSLSHFFYSKAATAALTSDFQVNNLLNVGFKLSSHFVAEASAIVRAALLVKTSLRVRTLCLFVSLNVH